MQQKTEDTSVAYGFISTYVPSQSRDKFFAVFVRRLSATAVQNKKDSGLEQCSLLQINHAAHCKFRYGTALCAVVARATECLTLSRNKTVTSTAEPDELLPSMQGDQI